MTDSLLSVRGLKTVFDAGEGAICAVDQVSFEIGRGEIVSLVGESGCGKTMMALSLLRLVPKPGRITAGEIVFDGVDLCRLPEETLRSYRGRKMAMIFQEPSTALNPVMTVGSQIAEVIEHHFHKTSQEAYPRVCALLDRVGIPDPTGYFRAYPHQLSGGMKQRVMIAMALAGEPDLLIADEPTTALDVTLQAQILELLRGLQKERGMSILLITHDLGVVLEMANHVAVMYAGQIIESRDARSFFENPLHPYSQKLFDSLPHRAKRGSELMTIRGAISPLAWRFAGCRFVNRCDQAGAICESTRPSQSAAPEIASVPKGDPKPHVLDGGKRDPDQTRGFVCCHLYDQALAPAPAAPETRSCAPRLSKPFELQVPTAESRDPLLRVLNLTVHFPIYRGLLRRVSGWVQAVNGVSFEIASGKTVALVGESGCGKTTTGKALLQLIRPTAGEVVFRGTNLTQLPEKSLRPLRRAFQIIFQDPYGSLNPRMTVGDIIHEGWVLQGRPREEAKEAMGQLLCHVGLERDAASRYPHEFSGGQRQRISIARALSVNPRLVVCDEPTAALDVSIQAQILNLLKGLQKERGLAYLFITHNLSIVAYFADVVHVMYLGRIVESGKVDEVLASPQHPYTQALLSAVPQMDPTTKREVIRLAGDPPSASHPPSGCAFHPRCPHRLPICNQGVPAITHKSPTHQVSCHLYAPASPASSVEGRSP